MHLALSPWLHLSFSVYLLVLAYYLRSEEGYWRSAIDLNLEGLSTHFLHVVLGLCLQGENIYGLSFTGLRILRTFSTDFTSFTAHFEHFPFVPWTQTSTFSSGRGYSEISCPVPAKGSIWFWEEQLMHIKLEGWAHFCLEGLTWVWRLILESAERKLVLYWNAEFLGFLNNLIWRMEPWLR